MLMFWGDETVFSVPSDVVELTHPPTLSVVRPPGFISLFLLLWFLYDAAASCQRSETCSSLQDRFTLSL